MSWRWLAFLLFILAPSSALAVAPCAGVPYSFVNGTIAQAPQVNADFTALQNCITAITAGAGAASGIAVFDSSGNLTVPGPTVYVGGGSALFVQNVSGAGFIRDTNSLNLGYGSTNVLAITSTGVASQKEIDAPNIGDTTYVTPQYCSWASFGTDQTACIQSAVNAACAAGRGGNVAGVLSFARAGYYIKAAAGGVAIPKACSGLFVVGQGNAGGGSGYNSPPALGISGTWFFTDNNCVAAVFQFNSDATVNYNYGGGIRNVSFYNAPLNGDTYGSTSCKRPLIQVKYAEQFLVQNIYAWLPYQVLQIIGGNQDKIENVLLDQMLQDSPGVIELFGSGAHPDATGQGTRQDGVMLSDIFGGGGPIAAGHQSPIDIYQHGFSASMRGSRVAFEQTGTALKIDCTVPAGYTAAAEQGACTNYDVLFDFEAEVGGGYGIQAKDMQSLVLYWPYIHGFGPSGFGGGMGNGIDFRNSLFTTASGLQVFGGQITAANHAGIEEEAAASIIEGASVYDNNLQATGGADVVIDTPVSGDAKWTHQIVGNTFCVGNGGTTYSEVPGYFETGNDYIMYTNNIVHGCSSVYVDSSGGTHNTLTPNGSL